MCVALLGAALWHICFISPCVGCGCTIRIFCVRFAHVLVETLAGRRYVAVLLDMANNSHGSLMGGILV